MAGHSYNVCLGAFSAPVTWQGKHWDFAHLSQLFLPSPLLSCFLPWTLWSISELAFLAMCRFLYMVLVLFHRQDLLAPNLFSLHTARYPAPDWTSSAHARDFVLPLGLYTLARVRSLISF